MQSWKKSASPTQSVGFLLFERFSNHCLANALEPFRAANTLLGTRAYDWHILSLTDDRVTSSSGLPVVPTARLDQMPGGAALFVLPSYGYRDLTTAACARTLRRAAGRYQVLAGLDTGSWLMAAAGLLDGRRATIHFEVFDAFSERFPEVTAERSRWIDEGDRVTSGGAMAAFDLVLHLIGRAHGTALTLEIAALFMHDEAAPSPMAQRGRGDRLVDRAVAEMERHIETPQTIAALAAHLGCTQRDLEQRMGRQLGATPQAVQRRLRLTAARRMLDDEAMPVAEVAERCGYGNASAFSRAFRREFGQPPSARRRR